MTYLLKKYWYIFVLSIFINLPILCFATIRTDKTLTLKGDTTLVEQFVRIENGYSQEGTFSTIYVISLDHSTLLQNYLVGNDSESSVENLADSYLHFTDDEIAQMGQIQHTASIEYALMNAYNAAKKKRPQICLDSKFDSVIVSYYAQGSDFRIGDKIIGINDHLAKDDFEEFRESFNNRKIGDRFQVMRNQKELSIEYNEKNQIFGGYSDYLLDEETAFPKFTIQKTNVGGPSGGLLQTLAIYNQLIEEDITKGRKIAGTGTIELDGSVGEIGGIQQKIYTAYEDHMEIFLCPENNYEDALVAYNKLKHPEKMKLYKISTFEEALEVLEQ